MALIPNDIDFLFAGCCGCCAALRPRYKKLVDNIFPVNPEVKTDRHKNFRRDGPF